MVYVPHTILECPGFHSRKGQCFACQFLSIVAQISAFLVYWEGIGDHISLSALSVCSHRSVGTHMCRQKHAAACRSVPQHAAACRSVPQHAAAQEIFPRDRTSLIMREARGGQERRSRAGRSPVGRIPPPPHHLWGGGGRVRGQSKVCVPSRNFIFLRRKIFLMRVGGGSAGVVQGAKSSPPPPPGMGGGVGLLRHICLRQSPTTH